VQSARCFLSWLLVTALGDLILRRAERNAPRSSVLLAWQRVSFDSVLLLTMLVDVTISLVSFRPGMTAFVLLGLVFDKISVVAARRVSGLEPPRRQRGRAA
jgi:hypothetical protein